MDVPIIYLTALPEGEWELAREVQFGLWQLGSWITRFEGALKLMGYSQHSIGELLKATNAMRDARGKQPHNEEILGSLDAADKEKQKFFMWSGIAADDASMTVFHFNRTIELIRSSLAACPALAAMVPRNALKQATKEFNKVFADHVAVRNAYGHAADVSGRHQRDDHSISGGYESAEIRAGNADSVFLSMLTNQTKTVTINGRVLQFELSQETLNVLRRTADAIYAAVAPAASCTENAVWEATQKARRDKGRGV